MKKVMVTGAAGQLGSTVVERLSRVCDVFPFTRAQLDIADAARVLDSATSVQPDVIINCAAYNDVDGAEDAAATAIAANALGVLALARAANEVGATFVHYSTDFVFDGRGTRPYVEEDPPRPVSHYGRSKLLGEWFAADAPASYILRVESLFGGQPAKSSTDKIIAAIRAGQPVRVFSDRTVTPSNVDDVTRATQELLARGAPFGVYHCVNSGSATWLEIAEEAGRLLQAKVDLVPMKMAEVQMKAQRPQYCALSNKKLVDAGVTMSSWQTALANYLRRS
jgi:dTDP-4-dehydrorhamnose reductase